MSSTAKAAGDLIFPAGEVPVGGEVPQTDELAASAVNRISSEEAAVMLGCTRRNVGDLCKREVLTSGRIERGRLRVDRAEVEALVFHRAEARRAKETA